MSAYWAFKESSSMQCEIPLSISDAQTRKVGALGQATWLVKTAYVLGFGLKYLKISRSYCFL